MLVHNFKCGEEVYDKEPSYESARNTLMNETYEKSHAFKNGSLSRSCGLESSYAYNKIDGRVSYDGKTRWRLDYDPKKGVHFNIEDYSRGKGFNGINIVIPIDISYEQYKKIINLWN